MASCFEYNRIWIVESLASYKTGRRLSDDLGVLEAKHAGLRVEYRDVASAADLFALLDRILAGVRTESDGPILHLESHGSQHGIILQDGTEVSWRNFGSRTARINAATGHNLLVVVSACWGGHFVKSVTHKRRAPFHAIVGPKEEIEPAVLEHDWVGFYKAMIASGDIEIAASELSTPHESRYYIRRSEDIFRRAFAVVRNGPTAAADRIFLKYKRIFFSLDLHPHRKKDFAFTLAECNSLA